MVFLNLQGRFGDLWFARASYRRGRSAKPTSALVFLAIVFLHLVLIGISFNIKSKQREASSAPFFRMIYLSPQKPSVELEVIAPSVEFTSTKAPIVPEIVIEEQSAPIVPFDTSSDSVINSQVFDPKMRQKLIDAQALNKPRAKEKSGSWTESDGRVFIDMGDGNCFVSMPKTDWRERGTNWGGTRCGKTDSEKMMDSVMADFESRKNPLKEQ